MGHTHNDRPDADDHDGWRDAAVKGSSQSWEEHGATVLSSGHMQVHWVYSEAVTLASRC